MAAGDITELTYVQAGAPGGFNSPKSSTVTLEFGAPSTGLITVNATDIGFSKITGFLYAVWGSAAGVGDMVSTTTAYVVGGVNAVDLQCLNDASTLVDRTVTVQFFGT